MPRSHCENENVHFVQDLAEVDGPFESPININFKDLTKLELPSLVWNRSDVCPKKMKITNTGHTVIITGKWKCELPYLTGGPLLGKYVFSQIHFHWGQDDCKGSEHLVSGESFPLEMHVAHFKSDYVNQECALREKDGMVMLVYLFKLQEEPNASLKKILNALSCVRQANCFQPLDPKPILSLCNPFTDDYFMYWGSVVTSSCAHILMWLVCREPFGISRDQVNEFRKILDSSQQPICRNNRDTQPLHKRNVFHVNASKFINCPLLPIKKIVGCFCGKGSEDNESVKSTKDCCCQGSTKNQEEIQEGFADNTCMGTLRPYTGGVEPDNGKLKPPGTICMQQSLLVQRAAVHSTPLLPKLFENTYLGQLWPGNSVKETLPEEKPNTKLATQSCCFIPMTKTTKVRSRPEKRRPRPKTFNSMKALSRIMESLEALKSQTCKKLKEIDSINQEIKGMKSLCQGANDQRWLRKIEKILTRKKRFTMKSSQGCLGELKKLAKECNIDQFFESKLLTLGDKSKLTNVSNGPAVLDTVKKSLSKEKSCMFSSKAQKLIRSFFEDIQDNEDLQLTLQSDIKMRRSRQSHKSDRLTDSGSILSIGKGYITKKMFNMGNLGDRFFIAVSSEDLQDENTKWNNNDNKLYVSVNRSQTENQNVTTESDVVTKDTFDEMSTSTLKFNTEEIIPLHRVNIDMGFPHIDQRNIHSLPEECASDNENQISVLESVEELMSTSHASSERTQKSREQFHLPQSSVETQTKETEITKEIKMLKPSDMLTELQNSTSNLSTDSTGTQRMIIAKFHKKQSKNDIWEQRSQLVTKVSSKNFKTGGKKQKRRNINVEGYYIKKKNMKNKRKKVEKERNVNVMNSSQSSASKEDIQSVIGAKNVYKWKHMTKARFKLKIEGTSDSTTDSATGYSIKTPRKSTQAKSHKTKGDGDNKEAESSVSPYQSPEHSPTNSTEPRRFTMEDHLCDSRSFTRETEWKITREKKEIQNVQRQSSRDFEKVNARNISNQSRNSIQNKPDLNSPDPTVQVESRKREILNIVRLSKNRSYTNLSPRLKNRTLEISKRIFIQTNEERCRLGRDLLEMRRKMENSTPLDTFQYIAINEVNKVGSSKSIKKSKGEEEDRHQPDKTVEFDVGFFTTSRKKTDEKTCTFPSSFTQELTVIPPKSFDPQFNIENHYLDKELHEAVGIEVAEEEELKRSQVIPTKTESNKSIATIGPDMKGDANAPATDLKDLSSTVSYTTIKKNSQSRPHSVESLTSLRKTCKKKHKKRPHCCKRISKHHIRKNSCVFKKPNRIESKQINFLNLSNEEQLKIISVNVAKYLKQKLDEPNFSLNMLNFSKTQADLGVEQNQIEKKIVPLETLEPRNKVSHDISTHEMVVSRTGEYEVNELAIEMREEDKDIEETVVHVVDTEPIIKIYEPNKQDEEEIQKTETAEEVSEIKMPKESLKSKKSSTSPRPPLNFIKLNKLMAGKYKRNSSIESKVEGQESKKVDEPKMGNLKKKNSQVKGPEVKKPGSANSQILKAPAETHNSRKPPKGNKANSEKANSKKADSENNKKSNSKKKSRKNFLQSATRCDSDEPDVQIIEPDNNSKTVIEVNKTSSSLVPASYLMTPYLPPSIEMPDGQQKMNQFLVDVKKNNKNSCLPEVLYETKTYYDTGTKKNDAIFAKDLENLIKLQMCLNNEIAANIENSMNYIKTLLSQDYNGSAIVEKAPINDTLELLDSSQNGIVLIEMNDLMNCSSSSSDFGDEVDRCSYLDPVKPKAIADIGGPTPKESGDANKMIKPVFVQDLEGDEDYNSDSSYNCEISITLNKSSNELEVVRSQGNSRQDLPAVNCGHFLTRGDSNTSQMTTKLNGGDSSQSIVLKPLRKKRKDNEISMEMKKKLLEILEGEIRREMALNYAGSSENSSDALTLRWDESNLMNRSLSGTESSSDNTEVLAQISETMRQYLSEYKKRRLVNKNADLSDKSKIEDDS